MSLKLILVCATLAVVSCARLNVHDHSQQIQQQQEMIELQNEEIREHQRVSSQQQRDQIRQLEDQRRRQEQTIRDHDDEHRRDHFQHVFIAPQPHFLPASIRFVTVPSSSRTFARSDDFNYNFGYAVSDLTTGDRKSQYETRRGDQVQGQYSMMDADGFQRIVDYRADDENGFDAEVRREPVFASRSNNNNYAPRYYHQHAGAQFMAAQPTIYATTSVSRSDDGQRNHYTSSTASNF